MEISLDAGSTSPLARYMNIATHGLVGDSDLTILSAPPPFPSIWREGGRKSLLLKFFKQATGTMIPLVYVGSIYLIGFTYK